MQELLTTRDSVTSTSDLVRQSVLTAGYAMAILLLFFLTTVLVMQLIRELRQGDTPRMESHWGGFGGGLGGWQLSRSLLYLLASLGFAILTVTLLGNAADDLTPNQPEPVPGPENTPAAPKPATSGGSPPSGDATTTDGAKPSAGTAGSAAPVGSSDTTTKAP